MSVPLLTIITAINDANMVVAALLPLVKQAMAAGVTDVSDEDVAASRAKAGGRIEFLDAMLAADAAREPDPMHP